MNHGSLFSGIGGFDLAAEWMGWNNCFHCEWNEFGQKILNYYWPKAKSYGDITTADFTIWNGRIDILTGGFPCQPFSNAGKKKGSADERYLWEEMLRSIKEIKPRWVVGENVANITKLEGGKTFETICISLENEGYKVQPYIIPAAAQKAWHVRERVWLLAHNSSVRVQRNLKRQVPWKPNIPEKQDGRIFQEIRDLPTEIEPFFSGTGNGVSTRIYNEVLKGLGNAIVPQVALQIFKAIDEFNRHNPHTPERSNR